LTVDEINAAGGGNIICVLESAMCSKNTIIVRKPEMRECEMKGER